MPILVTCPKCATKLNAPDSAAGKAVRCPKSGCGTVVPVAALVPAEEAPVVDGKVVAKPRKRVEAVPVEDEDEQPRKQPSREDDENDRPRRRSRRDDDDERPRGRRRRDDEDDYDDRPRRRRRGGGGGGGGKAVGIVAAILAGVAVLGGLGYGIYRLAGGGGSNTPPPPGWKQHTYEFDGFRAYFPKQPDVLGADRENAPDRSGSTIYSCGMFEPDAEHRVGVVVIRLAADTTAADRERMMGEFRRQYRGSMGSVKWLGHTADEMTGPDGTARIVFVGSRVYIGVVGAGRGGRVTSEIEKGFFDNVELLK